MAFKLKRYTSVAPYLSVNGAQEVVVFLAKRRCKQMTPTNAAGSKMQAVRPGG